MDRTDHCFFRCDWTDGEDPLDELLRDKGCCAPPPVRRDCLAPVLPLPKCGETNPIITNNPETGQFAVLTTLFDSNCSAITDSNGSPFLTLIA
jgi:hypothetical protein